jgi:hypothetical protein
MTTQKKTSPVESVAAQVVGLGGVGAFVGGIHLIHPPSALIASGVLAVTWAVLKSMRAP